MVFQIKVQDIGEHRIASVIWQQKRSPILKSILGPFQYYRFLQDLFVDLSHYQRLGEMGFTKPGLGDLCIEWKIDDDIQTDEMFSTLIAGINRINNVNREHYICQYAVSNVFRIINTDYLINYAGPFTVIGKAWRESPKAKLRLRPRVQETSQFPPQGAVTSNEILIKTIPLD